MMITVEDCQRLKGAENQELTGFERDVSVALILDNRPVEVIEFLAAILKGGEDRRKAQLFYYSDKLLWSRYRNSGYERCYDGVTFQPINNPNAR
jgi:hypothetical protein